MRFIAMTRRDAIPVFVTLTYPAEFPLLWDVYKRHLDTFSKRFRRKFPAGSFVWRLEFQKRGAPHYHLLVWNVGYHDLLTWVHMAWFNVVDSGDINHLLAGTRVEEIRSWRGVSSYASKYLSKVFADEHTGVGRWWGYCNLAAIPMAECVTFPLSKKQAFTALRYFRRFSSVKGRDYKSLTVFLDGSTWLDKLPDHLADFD